MEGKNKRMFAASRNTGGSAGEAVREDPSLTALSSWLIPAGIIIAMGLLVYANSLSGAFVFDDTNRIVWNRNIRSVWPLWQLLEDLGRTRPLIQLSLAINYAFGGLDVPGYHAFNLSVHILAALILFGIVRRTLRLPPLRDRFGGDSSPLALAVALIWMVHPIQTQAVTYIIQRCESMMGLFYLLTLYCVIRGWSSSRSVRWHGAAVVFCALGMMSKEVMVTAPLMVLLYDYLFLSGSLREILRRRKSLYAALASTWGILFLLLFSSFSETTKEALASGTVSPLRYVLTQFGVIVHYFRLSVWPDSLVLDYDWPPAVTAVEIVPYAILVTALVAGTLWAIRHKRPSGLPGAWFFLILAPTSSVMPLRDAAFEHRMYLPLAAVVSFLVLVGYAAFGRLFNRTGRARYKSPGEFFGGALLVLVVIMLGCLTVLRNRDYQSELAIWSDTVGKCPENARAQINLGVALRDLGRFEDAASHFRQALRLKPDFASGHNNLGIVLVELGEFEEAFAHYQQAVRLMPDYAKAHNNLGAFLLNIRDNPQEAIPHFEKSLQIEPDYPEAHNNLGVALYRMGRFNVAVGHFQQALRLEPDFVDGHKNLGLAFLRLGKFNEAVRHYQRAGELEPDSPETQNNLGIAFLRLGGINNAASHFQQALRLEPDYPEAHLNLGVALRKLGRGQEAAHHFEESLRFKPDEPETLNNLGIVLVELGEYEEAFAHYQQALRLRPEDAETHNNLGAFLLEIRNNPQAAIPHFEKSLQINPDYPETHYNLGVALDRVGRVNDAVGHFQQALQLMPDHESARTSLKRLLEQLEKKGSGGESNF